MRKHVLGLLAMVLAGCSSTTTTTTDTASMADAAPDATDPDTAVDAGVDAPVSGCIAKRASAARECAEQCDARLALPGGGSYCTAQCERTSDCSALGGDLICPETIGACVPTCTVKASCTELGFLRCDADAGACDTL